MENINGQMKTYTHPNWKSQKEKFEEAEEIIKQIDKEYLDYIGLDK